MEFVRTCIELWEDHSRILIRSSKVWKIYIFFGGSIVVYVLNDPTAFWLVPMYFDPYIGSSYMIQVVFCPYVNVKGKEYHDHSRILIVG